MHAMSATMSARLALCLHALLLSLLLGACSGGGGQGDTTTAATPAPEPTTPDPTPPQASPQLLAITPNSSGTSATYTAAGFINRENPFFQRFGNGRTCASCHLPSDGWSLTPASAQAKFNATDGIDPLFLAIDAANSPKADTSSLEARRAAFSMLLGKGLIRFSMSVAATAEFSVQQIDDPYGYASSAELSLFRRPLPAANLKFLASVMWDGRETYVDANSGICLAGTTICYSTLNFDLGNQANHAVLGHAQAAVELSEAEKKSIVDFEMSLFTAQIFDNAAKSLGGLGAGGDPFALSKVDFYFGINDRSAGDYRTKAPFSPQAMRLYNAWASGAASLADPDTAPADAAAVTAARQSVARGQALFNTRTFSMSGVGGLNDDLKIASFSGTCTSCHNAPDAGGNTTPLFFNIGTSDVSRRTSDLPLYTLKNKQTGETIQTTDPGLAMQSGKWQDIGRIKVPVLRGMAARPPYFHDGSAKNLNEVVDFYNSRFGMGLSAQEIADLTAFLRAL